VHQGSTAFALQEASPGVYRLCGGGEPRSDRVLPGISRPDGSGYPRLDRRQQGTIRLGSIARPSEAGDLDSPAAASRATSKEKTVSSDNKVQTPQAKESSGLLHRLFGRGGEET